MNLVFVKEIRVNQDVVEVYNNKDVVHVIEDVVYKILEDCRRVTHTEGHY